MGQGLSFLVKTGWQLCEIYCALLGIGQVFLRCFRDPRIENRVPRTWENYHRVPRIRENRVPRIREIGSLKINIRYLTFSLKKLGIGNKSIYETVTRDRLRGRQRGQLPQASRCKGSPHAKGPDTRMQLYIIFLCCVKYQGPPTATDFTTTGCQTHLHWGPYQHYGCPERTSCYCMVALKRPVVTELTTIIYTTLMLKERLCDNNGYFPVKKNQITFWKERRSVSKTTKMAKL